MSWRRRQDCRSATAAEITAAAQALIERLRLRRCVLVLLGREGMILAEPGGSVPIAPASGESRDSGGTEDTALAALAAGVGAGLPLAMAARIAGIAAGIARSKTGTAVASAGELAAALAAGARSEPRERALGIEMAAQPRRGGQGEAQR